MLQTSWHPAKGKTVTLANMAAPLCGGASSEEGVAPLTQPLESVASVWRTSTVTVNVATAPPSKSRTKTKQKHGPQRAASTARFFWTWQSESGRLVRKSCR